MHFGIHLLWRAFSRAVGYNEQSVRLEEHARKLGVDARELAKAAVNDLLTRPADDFDRAAKFVLEKK